MWQSKIIHNLKTVALCAGSGALALTISACNSVDDNNLAVIAAANSGLGTQLLEKSLSVQAGTEQAAL